MKSIALLFLVVFLSVSIPVTLSSQSTTEVIIEEYKIIGELHNVDFDYLVKFDRCQNETQIENLKIKLKHLGIKAEIKITRSIQGEIKEFSILEGRSKCSSDDFGSAIIVKRSDGTFGCSIKDHQGKM